MCRSVPFNVVKMMPMMDAFSYQPITSVSRIAALSDDAIARIADGLRISFNLFNPRSTNANGIPVRSHLRHSNDSKRLNKASSATEDAPTIFSLLSCFMVLQGSGLHDQRQHVSWVIQTDSHFRGDSANRHGWEEQIVVNSVQATAFCVPNNGPVSSDAEGSNTKSPKLILHSHAHLSSRNCPTLAQPAEVMDRRSASTRNRAPRTAKTVRRFQILDHLLAGSLSESHYRCGKETCHCASDEGHSGWTLTFMVHGQKRVDRIPQDRVDEVRQRVDAGREFQDAVRQVLAANAHGFNPSQQVRTS